MSLPCQCLRSYTNTLFLVRYGRLKIHFYFVLVFIVVLLVTMMSKKTAKYTWIAFLVYGPIALTTLLGQQVVLANYAKNKYKVESSQNLSIWHLGGYNLVASSITDVQGDMMIPAMGFLYLLAALIVWIIILVFTDASTFGDNPDDMLALEQLGAKRFMGELASENILFLLAVILVNLLLPVYPLACSRILTTYLIKVKDMNSTIVSYYSGMAGMVLCVVLFIAGMFLQGTPVGIFLMTLTFTCFQSACKLFMLARTEQHANHETLTRPLFTGDVEQASRPVPSSRPPSRPPSKKSTKESNEKSDTVPHKKKHTYDVRPSTNIDE